MLNRNINLLSGAPELYSYGLLVPKVKPSPRRLISLLIALLLAETAAFGFYIYKTNPSPAFSEIEFFKKYRGSVLGIATESAQTESLDSAQNVTGENNQTPTPTTTPTVTVTPLTPTPKVDFKIYTVKTGDNWWSIVQKTCGTNKNIPELTDLNQERNSDTSLHQGDNLKIYCGI